MKLETKINKESKYRIHTLTGEFDFDALFEFLVGVYDDPNIDPDLNSVWNLTDVESALQWIT